MARWDDWNPPTIEKPVARLEWSAPYAALVHEGAEGGGVIYPGRPWTDYAIAETNFEGIFQETFKAVGGLQVAFQATVEAFVSACQEAMIAPAWYWPTTTYRYNGEIVPPGLRNTYDLGDLYNSLITTYEGGVANA